MASEPTEDVSEDVKLHVPSDALYQALKDLCINNAKYYHQDDTESGQRLYAGFLALIDHVEHIAPLADDIARIVHKYDFDAKTRGNGYRSFVAVVHMCIMHGVEINREVCTWRDSFLFRKSVYAREVEACGHVLASLGTFMPLLKTLVSWGKDGELFPSEPHSPEELLKTAASINMYCFYGRCLGFQFCKSMRKVLKTLSILMASFSEIYYGNGGLISKATNSLWTGGKYFLDPELRARRIVNISQHASIDFCKSFWLLSESALMSHLPGMICPTVAVNIVVAIPPEPLEQVQSDGSCVQVPVPTAHLGQRSIQVRLLSSVRREGMIGEGKERSPGLLPPPSPHLIVHCHGGGFVAQSSRSHEMYLRDWACQLGVPILSVDYSLAPEAPYPRALQEVLYAYCWAVKNAHLLGSTAEKVLLVGDSAGANLNLGATLRCLELGLKPPSGLFLAYVPILVSFVPSPSRLLSLMDPLLPFGFLIRCLKAYACPTESNQGSPTDSKLTVSSVKTSQVGTSSSADTARACPQPGSSPEGQVIGSDTESFEEVSESDLVELAAHKSPMSDTLTTVSLASLQSKPEVEQTLRREEGSSERYVSDFLEKYVLDSETDSEGRKVPVLRTEGEERVLFELPPEGQGFKARLGRAAVSVASGFSSTLHFMKGKRSPENDKPPDVDHISLSSSSTKLQMSTLDSLMQRSPSEEFCFTVPLDPYLSPYWASDELLQRLPAVSILTVELDPCLDDCVMFAKKLKKLGNTVHLDVLEGLPHGFLNFSLLSKDAHRGSNLCVKRIQELLKSNDTPEDH